MSMFVLPSLLRETLRNSADMKQPFQGTHRGVGSEWGARQSSRIQPFRRPPHCSKGQDMDALESARRLRISDIHVRQSPICRSLLLFLQQ